MKIFLVEDDQNLNKAIELTFSNIGFEVTSFDDGREAFENISKGYDLFIVDINLPNVNGIELVKKIKTMNKDANVFIISAEIDIDIIVKAYDLGAADYIKKPFDIREILAKIEYTLTLPPDNIKFKNCSGEYKLKEAIFFHRNKEIRLTQKEARLLEILVKNANVAVSNEDIEKYVWDDESKTGHVRQLVAKLRKKLPCSIIENHTLNGYRVLI
jgi:DNA-binding response OmpR family regulator